MKVSSSKQVVIILEMSEAEALWLRDQMRNYVEPMRSPTQPPVLEEPQDAIMRETFFRATDGVTVNGN